MHFNFFYLANNRETKNILMLQLEEFKMKSSKYEERLRETEEQNLKHTDLLDRMKSRLKEFTIKSQEDHEQVRENFF